MKQLDDVVQGRSFTLEDQSNPLYALDASEYNTFMEAIFNKAMNVKDLIPSSDNNLQHFPELPVWGDENHSTREVYQANDYEILGVSFRCEMESYMNYVAHCHELFSSSKEAVKPPQKEEEEQPSSVKTLRQKMEEALRNSPPRYRSKDRENPFLATSQDNSKGSHLKPLKLVEKLGHGLPPNLEKGKEEHRSTSGLFAPVKERIGSTRFQEAISSPTPLKRSVPLKPADFEPESPIATNSTSHPFSLSTKEAHFDIKLKPDIVPKWNGGDTTLLSWLVKVNSIADRSETVRKQLGQIIPFRLKGEADTYWCSLPKTVQEFAMESWDNIRETLLGHFMNSNWIIKQRARLRTM
jgi:hypothetical protein